MSYILEFKKEIQKKQKERKNELNIPDLIAKKSKR